MANALRCRCGHDVETHEHFRGGSDCGACLGCHQFTTADPWRRLRSAEPVLSRPPRTPAR